MSEKESQHLPNVVEIEDRNGFYIEKPSLIDKYMRRDVSENPQISDITYLQFCKRYVSSRIGPKNEHELEPKLLWRDSKESSTYIDPKESPFVYKNHPDVDFIITDDFENKTSVYLLPKFIQINDPLPGEPAYMKLRTPWLLGCISLAKQKILMNTITLSSNCTSHSTMKNHCFRRT